MTKREIKKYLKNAYIVTPSQAEQQFVRQHEQRRMHIGDILRVEFKYMGIGSLFIGFILCIALFFIAKNGHANYMWSISTILPLCVVVPMTAIGRAENCGMYELEAACRFSLRFIKMIRMLILGTMSLILLLLCALFMHEGLGINFLSSLAWVGFPYLLNVSLSLGLIRRWHAKENIYGCMAITAVTAILPTIILGVAENVVIPEFVFGVALLIVMIVTVKESIMYMKESEMVAWN